MRRLPMLAVLLITALSVAACGGSESQRPEAAAPPEQGRTAPAAQGAATGSDPVQDPKGESAQGDGGSEAAGLSVTTLQGEEVAVGRQGDVTALYFMAGW